MKKSIIVFGVFLLSVSSFADKTGGINHSEHKQKVEKTVDIEIGKKGFKPQTSLNFKPNENIVLNITRTTTKTCMTELEHPKTGRLVALPINKKIRFDIGTYKKPTEIKLLCGMKMEAGVIHVRKKSS